jgi:hypothetical protein
MPGNSGQPIGGRSYPLPAALVVLALRGRPEVPFPLLVARLARDWGGDSAARLAEVATGADLGRPRRGALVPLSRSFT